MEPRLFILSGASGCGKTTLLNALCDRLGDPRVAALRPVRAPKYSERPERKKAGEIDDVTHCNRISLDDFDIAYVINNWTYGIRLGEIVDLLRRGNNVFVILSDFRVVREVKSRLGERCRAIYISSAIDDARLRRIQQERMGFRPDESQKVMLTQHFYRTTAAARLGWWDRVSACVADLEADWRAYATDATSTEIRTQRIRAFHTRYIEALDLFDHVILNYTEERPEEMVDQAVNVVLYGERHYAFRRKHGSAMFVLAGASASGKGTLLEMLRRIGNDRVRVVSKLAQRAPTESDRDDGMIPILGISDKSAATPWPRWWSEEMKTTARAGVFPPEYDLQWEFHKEGEHGPGVRYAVSSREIQENLDQGWPQVFVSNLQQLDRFRERWPHNCVTVYLHRLSSADEDRQYQLKKWRHDLATAELRIREKRRVHQDYIERIAQVEHVLLNTLFKEDLYDQMFRLLDVYGSPLGDRELSAIVTPKSV